MRPQIKSAAEWMAKAQEDLQSARVLLQHEPPLAGPASFHAQQAAEKSLKCFLVFREVEFDFVHNLEYLLHLCEEEERVFGDLYGQADALAPFAIDVRYPGGMEVSVQESQEVLSAAQTIYEEVVKHLPDKVISETNSG